MMIIFVVVEDALFFLIHKVERIYKRQLPMKEEAKNTNTFIRRGKSRHHSKGKKSDIQNTVSLMSRALAYDMTQNQAFPWSPHIARHFQPIPVRAFVAEFRNSHGSAVGSPWPLRGKPAAARACPFSLWGDGRLVCNEAYP